MTHYTKLILIITTIMSIVSFHFYNVVSELIKFLSIYCIDEYVPTYGLYSNKIPIEIITVSIDKEVFTNKFRLFLNWYWDFEMGGFNLKDYPLNFNKAIILYKIKKTDSIVNIVLNNETKTIIKNNNIESDIVFEECPLI